MSDDLEIMSPEEFGQLPQRSTAGASKWDKFFTALEGKPTGTAVKIGTYEDEDPEKAEKQARSLRNSLAATRRVQAGEFKVKARQGAMFLVKA